MKSLWTACEGFISSVSLIILHSSFLPYSSGQSTQTDGEAISFVEACMLVFPAFFFLMAKFKEGRADRWIILMIRPLDACMRFLMRLFLIYACSSLD